MRKFILIIFSAVFLLPKSLTAQNQGRIIYRDSTSLEFSDFTKLQTKLIYYNRSHQNPGNQKSVNDIWEFSPEKIHEITFKYEKSRGAGYFYYEFLIEGITSNGSSFKKKIKTWDWLEMSIPDSGTGKNTQIVVFTEKKNSDVVKIELGP
jgi:hypothetical protein